MVSKMVKALRVKGVFFDNENYFEPVHAWQYDTAWYRGQTFEEVRAKCRERGKTTAGRFFGYLLWTVYLKQHGLAMYWLTQ